MRLSILLAGALLGISSAIEPSPAASLSQNPNVLHRRQRAGGAVRIGPKPPFRPMPVSTPRTRECVVKSSGGSTDDSANILDAVKACNDGGRVVFSKSAKYLVGKAMDLSKLRHIDLDIQGTIQFSGDVGYWQRNAFKHGFQNAATFFQLGGVDVNVYGGGTLDGNGGRWKSDQGIRPILFGTIGLKGGVIKDLSLKNSPQWFNLVKDSKDVVFSNIRISGRNHNTDGWDTLKSSNIVIQDSHIENGDDCISFKPGSTEILIQGLVCSGSHGISVGSLGQYKNQVDIVENVMVHNVTMSNASNGARIKTWPGHGTMTGGVGSGGGGKGRVQNITFDGMRLSRVDYAIEITQCYGQNDMAKCKADPSGVSISNIVIQGFSGTTSGKHGSTVGAFTCSSSSNCRNISVRDMHVSAPGGGSGYRCSGVSVSGIRCGG